MTAASLRTQNLREAFYEKDLAAEFTDDTIKYSTRAAT